MSKGQAQLVEELLRRAEQAHPRVGFRRIGPSHIEVRGRKVRLDIAQGSTGSQELVVMDGPLQQPLGDYLSGSGLNEAWPESPAVQSALHGLPQAQRVSFEEVYPECRAEAMELAVLEAEAREQHAKEQMTSRVSNCPGPLAPPSLLHIRPNLVVPPAAPAGILITAGLPLLSGSLTPPPAACTLQQLAPLGHAQLTASAPEAAATAAAAATDVEAAPAIAPTPVAQRQQNRNGRGRVEALESQLPDASFDNSAILGPQSPWLIGTRSHDVLTASTLQDLVNAACRAVLKVWDDQMGSGARKREGASAVALVPIAHLSVWTTSLAKLAIPVHVHPQQSHELQQRRRHALPAKKPTFGHATGIHILVDFLDGSSKDNSGMLQRASGLQAKNAVVAAQTKHKRKRRRKCAADDDDSENADMVADAAAPDAAAPGLEMLIVDAFQQEGQPWTELSDTDLLVAATSTVAPAVPRRQLLLRGGGVPLVSRPPLSQAVKPVPACADGSRYQSREARGAGKENTVPTIFKAA